MVEQAFNPSTSVAEAGGTPLVEASSIYSKFQTNQGLHRPPSSLLYIPHSSTSFKMLKTKLNKQKTFLLVFRDRASMCSLGCPARSVDLSWP